MAESRKDEHSKTDKLSNIVFYKIEQDQVEKLKTKLLNDPFKNVELNYDESETDFELKLYAVVRESEDRLVNLLRKHIPADEYNKTYTRDNYILIAVDRSKQDVFAICSDKAYLHILPFADMDFAFNVAKAVLDPKKIMQIKYRFLNGTTITTDRHFHRSTPASNQVSYLSNIFFIVDEFQSTIAPGNETNYRILKESTLKCSVKVKKSNLTFCKSLSLQEILDLMHDLSHLKQNVTVGFEFLDVAKPIKDKKLISTLEKELITVLSDNKELNEKGFYLCPKSNDKWDKCEKVHLRNKNDQTKMKFMHQLHISDVMVALKKQSPDKFELNFKANGKWEKYDDLINYVHGSVVCDTKRYFHVGKNWYSVDEKCIERIETSFLQLMKEKLMNDEDEMCLPLPWHSKRGNEGTIDAEHCIRFCKNVLKKTDDKVNIPAIMRRIPGKCKSPPVALRDIIGQPEYELYEQSLKEVDEGKYNGAYISLDNIWKNNTNQGPHHTFLVGDKITVQNVELFDILLISDEVLCLYHVKEGLGQKTRDVASQIHTSASLLYKAVKCIEEPNVLDDWYDSVRNYIGDDAARLKQKYHLSKTIEDKEKFRELFRSKKIIYIYAFLDDSKIDRFQNLVLDQLILNLTDLYGVVPEDNKKVVELCQDLSKERIISMTDKSVKVERSFQDFKKSEKLLAKCKKHGLNNNQVKKFVQILGSQFKTTWGTKSYIAMAELLWLTEEFRNYPDFQLKFCQIRKPWRSDGHSSSASSNVIDPEFLDPKGIKTETTDITTLSEILTRLVSGVLEDGKNIVNVERSNILDGGFRAFGSSSFNPWRKLDVKFQGEDGIDDGGLGREFMRLALGAIKELPLFRGPDNEKIIVFDYDCWTEDFYYKAGQMLAYFIVHRGPCPNFFSRTLYNALAEDLAPMQPTPDEICNLELVEAIADASNEQDFKAAVLKAKEIIILAKCDDLTSEFNPEKKANLVESLSRFLVMEKFKEGLQTVELVDEIQKNKQQWEPVFIFSPKSLSASQIEELFPVLWSENKSERKKKEKKTQKHWRRFLKDLQGGDVSNNKVPLSLKDLLVFATGADQVPLLGFPGKPQLSFRHTEDMQEQTTVGFPMAVTCTMELMIPVLKDYRNFKRNMASAISMISTFTNQ